MTDKFDWQGRVGKEWADKARGLDLLLDPVGEAGINALGDVSGKCVLDVGCGSGSTSRVLINLGAQVTGVDISEDLLQIAKDKGGANYLLADASSDPLGGPYEAVYSRCGAMFFDDPVGGWAHIRKTAISGAILSIVCWTAARDNGWASIPLNAASKILGKDVQSKPPEGTPGPFAWENPEYFAPVLEQSGWLNLNWQAVGIAAELSAGDSPDPIERAAQFSLRIGPLARRLAGTSPDVREQVGQALRTTLQDYLDGDAVRVPTKAWIITGNA
jgi:SAM-dependent methyltransferase